jgi:hypothetical protein
MIQSAQMKPDVEIGMTSGELLMRILDSLAEIRTVTFIQFQVGNSFADRVARDRERPRLLIASEAAGEPREAWLPEHEILFAQRLAEGADINKLIGSAVKHDKHQYNRLRSSFDRDQLSIRTLESLREERPGWALAVSSSVQTTGGELFHLPLMDFQCPVSERNLALTVGALASIGRTTGAVVESGRSYHYYGFDLLSLDAWYDFLGSCLLLSPIVDGRYIGHRLLDKECVLRLGPSQRKPQQPRVVHILGSPNTPL